MNVAILVCTYGGQEWVDLAWERAIPSACLQQAGRERDVRVLSRHEPEGTLASTRNFAAREAAAGVDWLCFLDADDELDAGYIDAMETAAHLWNLWRPYDIAANPLLLTPALRTVDARTGKSTPAALPNRHEPMNVLNHCVIGTLVPRRLFLEVGGFKDEAVYEDWALFLRCIRAGARIVDVPDAVYVATANENGRNAHDDVTYWKIRNEHDEGSLPHGPA